MSERYYQSRRLVIVAAEPMSPEKVIAEVRCDLCKHYFHAKHTAPSCCWKLKTTDMAPDFGCALFEAKP